MTTSATQPGDAARVELAAARALLEQFEPESVSVVATLSKPRTAPGASAGRARPLERQHMLADSIAHPPFGRRGSLTLDASDPELHGDHASISVTVSGDSTWNVGHGRFYETVDFTLERHDGVWRVVRREQLGVS